MKAAAYAPPPRRTLHFPTLVELVDFEMSLHREDTEVNRKARTLTAAFSAGEMEEARERFAAVEVRW